MAEVFDVRDIEYFMGIKVFNMVLDRPGVKMGKRRGMVERCMVAFENAILLCIDVIKSVVQIFRSGIMST